MSSTLQSDLLPPSLMARLERLELVSRKIFRGRMKGERAARGVARASSSPTSAIMLPVMTSASSIGTPTPGSIGSS
ncbi:MAG: hypothetical protein R3C10_09340 [Pirellulales bacterium]